jgi:hypothetical protein
VNKVIAASAFLGAMGTVGVVSAFGASQTTARVLEARVGDRIHVLDAPIGCRVARMSQLGGRVAVDCRKAGPLRGRYGTFLTAREAVLVEFESRRTARRVAVGVHEGKSRGCR